MTMQMTKPGSVTFQSNWKTIFPDFTTLTGSCQFIKKLMAVSVSAITYMRGVFPDKAYGERNLCGIKLKLLTEESGIKAVDQFIDFVRSCYDAIDRKYLNQVSIGICTDPENRDEVLESYNINFRYSDDEYGMSNKTSDVKLEEKDPTVQATLMLLKSITYITDILGPIPTDAYLTMKLLFNDDITPPDYQPQGFEPSLNEKFFFPPNAVKLELGKVSTEFNNYRMFLKTALSKEPLSQIYEESLLTGSQRSLNNENNAEDEHENYNVPSPRKVPQKSPDFVDDVVTINHEKGKVECICECRENSGTSILQCTVCGRKQHSVCYGFLNSPEVDSEFYCTQCISDAPYMASQDAIYTNENDEQKELSAMRRALVFCAKLKQVTPFQLERGLKCDKQLAKDMIAKLEVEGFVKKSGQKYIVNDKKIIKKGYWMYFRRTEDKENLEISEKPKQSPANASDDADFENERTVRHKKKLSIKADKTVPVDEYMDFAIEDEVEKLNLKGPEEKLVHKASSKRRSSKPAVDDDPEDTFQKKPRKRRCLNKNEIINLKE